VRTTGARLIFISRNFLYRDPLFPFPCRHTKYPWAWINRSITCDKVECEAPHVVSRDGPPQLVTRFFAGELIAFHMCFAYGLCLVAGPSCRAHSREIRDLSSLYCVHVLGHVYYVFVYVFACMCARYERVCAVTKCSRTGCKRAYTYYNTFREPCPETSWMLAGPPTSVLTNFFSWKKCVRVTVAKPRIAVKVLHLAIYTDCGLSLRLKAVNVSRYDIAY